MTSAGRRQSRGSGKENVQYGTSPPSLVVPVQNSVMRAKGALTALLLLAAALTAVVPTVEEVATSAASATASAATASAATGCAGFQDDFAADYPGALNPALWDQAGRSRRRWARNWELPLWPRWGLL